MAARLRPQSRTLASRPRQLGLVVWCVGIRHDEEVVGSCRNLTVRLEIHDALASRSRPLAIRHHETVVGCARIEQLCASETQPGVWYTEPNASVIPLGTDEVIE